MISLLASLKRLTRPSATTLRGRRGVAARARSRPLILIPVVARLAPGRPAAAEEDQDQAGDEAADMGHVGDPAALRRLRDRAEAVEELEQRPEADHQNRRQLGELHEDPERDENAHP